MSGFGIQSVLIEPGGYPTSFHSGLLTPSDDSRNESYGDFMKVPEAAALGFGELLSRTPEQNPQKVADAIANLIDKPIDKRPFRTIVDFMEWSEGIQSYNNHLEQITKGFHAAFGTENMLTIKE